MAVARKLAVIMHQMWSTGEEFRWSNAESPAGYKHGGVNEIRLLTIDLSLAGTKATVIPLIESWIFS